MTTNKSVNRNDATQYASVANGTEVGSGYDVYIRRESSELVLVNFMSPSGDQDYLSDLAIEPDTDLYSLAIQIGNQPFAFFAGEYVDATDPDWYAIAERWDAIEVTDGEEETVMPQKRYEAFDMQQSKDPNTPNRTWYVAELIESDNGMGDFHHQPDGGYLTERQAKKAARVMNECPFCQTEDFCDRHDD